jgi:transposase
MLTTSPATRVWLAAGATDLRAGFDRLCILAQSVLGQQASSGHLFVFCNAARTRVRILYFDGTGLWLLTKKLERGRFAWTAVARDAEFTRNPPMGIPPRGKSLNGLLIGHFQDAGHALILPNQSGPGGGVSRSGSGAL